MCVAALLGLTACSTPSGGSEPATRDDAAADAPAISLNDDAADDSGTPDAAYVDATCAPPKAATGATSTRCTPEGPGSWTCADASGQGWLYSCEETAPGAHPSAALVGACSALAPYDFADASYVVALCANVACTAAAQYDAYCDSGTALACPDPYLEAGAKPGSGCVPSFIGEWSSGDGLPGPLYCCP